MSFFAILIALCRWSSSAHWPAPIPAVRYRAWTVTVRRNFDAGKPHHGWLTPAMLVLLPSLIVLGIFWVCFDVDCWPAAMLWNVAVPVTLGFRQFSQ
ncbi:hypothetical protein J4711_14740 [Staphylococcus epidermidis]|nr:hypothetical protein [Staphylococcus epidermidis]